MLTLKRASSISKQGRWSIGIYEGESPVSLKPSQKAKNPVLRARDVTDCQAEFVADPFMVKEGSTWYLFCEVMDALTRKAAIGLATSSDGLTWGYQQTVLQEPFHLSYPYVFRWKDAFFMIPESRQADAVRLYRSDHFPTSWSFVKTLMKGNFEDSSVLFHDGLWWLFSKTNPKGNDTLNLYFAKDLLGPWREHPKSPVVQGDRRRARPAGRIVSFNGRLIRYAQECLETYGKALWAYEISKLTTADYEERGIQPGPLLQGTGIGWNADRVHHVDPHRLDSDGWIACVDGYARVGE